MSKDKKKTEYEARRINFEENLRKALEKAHTEYAKGNFVKMCFGLQDVWRQAWEEDREAIIEMVEKRANQDWRKKKTRGRSERGHIDSGKFLKLITAQRDVVDIDAFEPDLNEIYWRDILMTTTEALHKEHLGKQRYWEERHEE